MDNVSPKSSDVLATAPPPPSEVKIRTMRSDLESMSKSGGGLPQFQNIKVSGSSAEPVRQVPPPLSSPAVSSPSMPASDVASVPKSQSSNKFFAFLAGVIVIAILAAGGWFAYTAFFNKKMVPPVVQLTAATTSTSTPTVPSPTPTPTIFVHASAFKTPPDQVLEIVFSAPGAVQNASDLQTYSQKMIALLGTAKKGSAFLEIDAKDGAGNDASFNELLAAASAPVMSPQIVAADFNPDATLFVYKDASGFWPGYVVSLASGANQVSIPGDVKTIESSPDISNLFLENVGAASPDGFTDSVIASSSVRVLPFLGGTIPGYFTYGWTPDGHYLILSTSQSGFAQALVHLGE